MTNEADEVQQLRARVAELEGQLQSGPVPESGPAVGRERWRSFTAGTLIVLACLLAPFSVASVWASNQISDTDRYVETVAPLAHDPAVQKAIADEVTTQVLRYVDVEGVTTQVLDALARQDLPPRVAAALPALAVPLTNGIEGFARTQVGRLVASPAFATVWNRANRAAHQQLVSLLEGNQGGAVTAQGDEVTLQLGPIIAQVKNRLVAQGFSVADRIPVVNKSFVLVRSDSVTKAQGAYRLLNTVGGWLPFIALALFAAGVFLARGRRRALLRGSLGVAGAMLALGVGLALARVVYLNEVPPGVLDSDAAGSVFDTLVRFLRYGLRAVALLALLVALGAYFTGPSALAVRTRSVLERGIGSARGSAESAGLQTGGFGRWVFAHKTMLRTVTVIACGLVLAFWSQPTGAVVVVTALVVLLAIALVEFLGRPPVIAVSGWDEASPVPRQAQPSEKETPHERLPTDSRPRADR